MLRRLGSWANGFVSPVFPERRIILRSEKSASYLRLSPVGQLFGVAAVCGVLGWTGYSTISMADAVAKAVSAEEKLTSAARIRDDRIEDLTQETMKLAEAVSVDRQRAFAALSKLSDQHATLSNAVATERELATSLMTQRNRLDMLSGEHDASMQLCETTVNRTTALEVELLKLKRDKASLSDTLTTLTASLSSTASERDQAIAQAEELTAEMDALTMTLAESAERRNNILSRLEDAAQLSLGGLETVFERSGVKLDPILADVRREYRGEGGPFVPDEEPAAIGDEDGDDARVKTLLGDLEKINLLRIATDRMPFATPVRAGRFTSGYGNRKDPKNGRRAHHAGIDIAGPRGTPVYATASGRVVKAGWAGGYGKVIKIRNSFGYETVFAHLHRIRVKVGDVVDRGDRIGDMGNTGRSTGTHLHYEIRIDGRTVNPSKYIEAARHVL